MNDKRIYEITEMWRNKLERYCLKVSVEELKDYLKSHRESNGYIEGVGGDKSYECYAVLMEF